MRTFFQIAAALAVAGVLSLTVSLQAGASEYVNQADVEVVDAATNAFTEFINEARDSSSTFSSVISKANAAAIAMDKVANHSFSTIISAEYLTETEVVKTRAGKLAELLNQASIKLSSSDESEIEAYIQELSAAAEALDEQITKVSVAVKDSEKREGVIYLVLAIVSVVISVGAFIWGFRKKEASYELTKARRGVAFSSLWILGGAMATYLSFVFAEQLGGAYYVMYGPILIGLVAFVVSISNYLKLKRQSGFSTPPSVPPQMPAV